MAILDQLLLANTERKSMNFLSLYNSEINELPNSFKIY
jgi:hypothetical protein